MTRPARVLPEEQRLFRPGRPGQCVDNARRYTREHTMAVETLGFGLLDEWDDASPQ